MQNNELKLGRIFFWVFLITTVAGLYFACNLELTDQEAYYWTWSQVPDLSYFDHPPLQAWTTAALTWLFGQHIWVVRLPSIVGRLFMLAYFYRYASRRYTHSTGMLALLTILAMPLFLIGSVVTLPDALCVPLCVATLFYAEKEKFGRGAVCIGLAGLAKWTSIFFVPGYLFALWQSKAKKKWRFILVPFLFQVPVLVWNLRYHGASVLFHLAERHEHHLLPLLRYLHNGLMFLALQLFAGGLALVLLGVLFFGYRKCRTALTADPNLKHVLLWAGPVFSIVAVSAIQGQTRFYWADLGFFPLLAFLWHRVSKVKLREIPIAYSLASFAILNLVLISAAMFWPVGPSFEKAFFLRSDLRHSPRGDIAGWKDWVEKELRPRGLVTKDTAYLATDFRLSAQIAWAAQVGIWQTSTVGPDKNEYQYWPFPSSSQFRQTVFFADNRRSEIGLFEGKCAAPLVWNTFAVILRDETVKKIFWAVCPGHILAANGALGSPIR